ncbi:MAG: hypothetical protein JKX84_02945 [Flavobacteriales bacterium]|nr:hypothetical protein [Flavobacteriales bacterium]
MFNTLPTEVNLVKTIKVYAYQYGMELFAFTNPTGLILSSLTMVQVGFGR